ncbi:MAG TPA: transglutaminase domain-containing protein, partial [Candidatus Saccharimonadales bacterium]|nr:transglutaminase domain-containing protein [Candidatus Saccharimonadales bacterium]
MPEPDRKRVSAEYLSNNVALAYEAWKSAPWHDQVPKEIFFNEVLPYASINEARDDWRSVLREKCQPLVADCKTPAEAAQRLNQKLFKLVKVKYSTERKKADQSPLESMQSGLASCTGLSVLLIDACRSVGVPARLVGTPMWHNDRGNHTWVEVWDKGWHFTGAAEPDPKGLDRGWFTHDASLATKDSPEHAIYATSYKKTELSFPMVWARNADYVSAVNVTENYAAKPKAPAPEKARLLVRVTDSKGKRVAAKVCVTDPSDAKLKLEGTSRDELADTNDILPFEVAKNHAYVVEVEREGRVMRKEFGATTEAHSVLMFAVSDGEQAAPVAARTTQLKAADQSALQKALGEYFGAAPESRKEWKFSASLDRLLAQNEADVRAETWNAYRSAPIHEAAKKDFDNKEVRFDKHVSTYTVKTVGTRPANGWPLFIAMHGGGGAPKALNDSQWEHMKIYYKDHPEAGGYLYLALRAPNDTWNGFYDVYVYPLIENLVKEFLLFGDVDPNKVFIMGYSHGGYGAFAIGPKIPYRFAAIHASASAPTDGETTGKTLRNTIFTYMVGDLDTMYGRYDRCTKFNEQIEKLRGERKDIYPVTFQLIKGNGHGGLPD